MIFQPAGTNTTHLMPLGLAPKKFSAAGGRFVEIGKRDVWSVEEVAGWMDCMIDEWKNEKSDSK